MTTIHVDYVSKFMKWKHKTTFIEFMNRFYSPTLFIVMTLSAFDAIHYTYSAPLIILMAFVSSILVAYSSWTRWKKDFMYLAERNCDIPLGVTVFIVGYESVLQFLVSIVSFWWISGVPECIFKWYGIERSVQAYMWLALLIAVFILHVILWKKSSKEMERLLKTTYEHLAGRDIP